MFFKLNFHRAPEYGRALKLSTAPLISATGDFMKKRYNCPNCGAPISNTECPYCGTVFYDFTSISDEDPSYIILNVNKQAVVFRGIMRSVNIEYSPNAMYSDNMIINRYFSADINIGLSAIPDDQGVLIKRLELKEDK